MSASLACCHALSGWVYAAAAVVILATLAISLSRHLRSDWNPRVIRRAFREMDALDAREAPENEYAEALSILAPGLPGWGAAWAIERLADSDSPSRRRYLQILRSSDFSPFRDRLIALAKDPADPLAGEVWSILTGQSREAWKKALLATAEDAEFAPPAPPSGGPWCGFYRQMGGEHRMAPVLSMDRGAIRGGGTDLVGPFTIAGTISGQEVRFYKAYETHTVAYQGRFEGDTIVGRWSLPLQSGEFRLWPIRSAPPA
jgi:hypothetical protein